MNNLTKYRKWMAITKESQELRDHDIWIARNEGRLWRNANFCGGGTGKKC